MSHVNSASRTGKAATMTSPKLNVEVTQEIIETAIPRDSSHCMIADAVAAAYPDASRISVDLATIRFTDRKKAVRYIYLTPRKAQVALLDFDRGEAPAPFKIALRGAHILPAGPRRARAQLVPQPAGGGDDHSGPLRVGGDAPPMGPLPGGHLPSGAAVPKKRNKKQQQMNASRVGKRREFGVRTMG